MANTYIVSILIFIIAFLIFALNYFERRKVVVEKIVLVAMLSALSSAGRVVFAGIPSVQASSFMIMMAGLCFGKEVGLMTGIITAVASNLVLGMGPWMPWQMFLWGLMGFLTGLMRRSLKDQRWAFISYGFMWGLVFGWGMNLWHITGYMTDISMEIYILANIFSLPLDIAHGVSNVILILFAKEPLLRIFGRIAVKYKF